MFQTSLLSKPAIEELADGVMAALDQVGILCQNREIMDALAEWGARIDESAARVYFPPERVEAFAADLLQEYAPQRKRSPDRLEPPGLAVLGTQVAQFFYDDWQGSARPGRREDLAWLCKLGDALHPEAGVGHCLLLRDVPPLLEPLEAGLVLAEYAHRPGPPFAWDVRQTDYLIEMGEVLGIPDWFTWGATCFSHPFRFDKEVADRFVRQVRAGYATGLTGMQVSGATTPVTVAGFVVVSASEFVATWIAARAINPRVPLRGSMYGGTLDMKTGQVSYTTPDAMLRSFATVEFMRRWCGVDVPVGGTDYCDIKTPGLGAALEKAYKALTVAAFSGHHPGVGQAMVDNGKTLSAVQLLLDRELGMSVHALAQEVEVTPEAIGMEAILDVGSGLDKSYLEVEHTLRHYRASLYRPQLLDRSFWDQWGDEGALLVRTRRRIQELVASYQKPDVDPAKLAALREIVERARRELVG